MLSIRRCRPARVGALALALAFPLALVTAGPGFASGESTSAALTAPTSGSAETFTWTYTFNKNDGHGLSNLAIGFCSAGILAHRCRQGDVPGPPGPVSDHFRHRDAIRFPPPPDRLCLFPRLSRCPAGRGLRDAKGPRRTPGPFQFLMPKFQMPGRC